MLGMSLDLEPDKELGMWLEIGLGVGMEARNGAKAEHRAAN